MNTAEIEKKLRDDLFLDRDGETFVFERKDGRLGWEKTIPEGTGYSSYITDTKDDEELLVKAYGLARKMITAMNPPFKVNIKLNTGSGSGSYTDFSEVAVSTEVFDDESLTIGQKLDTFLGYAIHESCHLLYTEKGAGLSDELEHSLQNIIEDERIERICGHETPGLAKFIACAKYHAFDKAREGSSTPSDKTIRFVNAVLALIRYPKILLHSDIEEFGPLLLRAKDLLTPYPDSTKGSGECAKAIAALIREVAEEESKPKPKDDKTPDPEEGESEDTESKENESDDSESEENVPEDSEAEDSESEMDSDGESSGDDESSSGEADGTGAGAAAGGKSAEELLGEVKKLLGSLSKDFGSALDDMDASSLVRNERRIEKICDGRVERGMNGNSFFEKPELNSKTERIYQESLDDVKKYIPSVRRVLQSHGQELRRNLLGMRSGHFDVNKLADAFQGSQTVYRQQSVTKADNMAVCILIDESGSMYADNRIQSARKTAILLDQALSGIPGIDLYIYGHTADIIERETVITVYKEHGVGNLKALGASDARVNNRDGNAIREVARRVRRFTKDKCLFFVLSDGAPSAWGYSGDAAIRDTRAAVTEVTKTGFSPVQIAINNSHDPALMFDHYVVFDNMDTLPRQLGKIVRQAILKNATKTTM